VVAWTGDAQSLDKYAMYFSASSLTVARRSCTMRGCWKWRAKFTLRCSGLRSWQVWRGIQSARP